MKSVLVAGSTKKPRSCERGLGIYRLKLCHAAAQPRGPTMTG
jgi:hypothetical protein